MLTCSEAITRSALIRKESRGAHSRLDYPNLNPELGKVNTSAYKQGDEMKIEQIPLPEMPDDLKELFKK